MDLRRASWLLLCAIPLGTLGCEREGAKTDSKRKPPEQPVTARAESSSPAPEPPVDLVRLEESAYGAFLGFSGENLVLVGNGGVHFIAAGEPPRFHACPTGAHRALLGEDVVYYEEGRFFVQSARGGARKEFFSESREPKAVAGGRSGLLWITSDGRRERLSLRAEGVTSTLYETENSLLALTLDTERAHFVEGTQDGEWRLGTVELATKRRMLTPFEKTRSPATLAASGRAYFYDGTKRSVLRTTSAFSETEVVAGDVICSPLATFGERIYCAQVGGLGELREGRTVRPLPIEVRGPVTTLTANETHLAWLEDAGRSALVARVFELPR